MEENQTKPAPPTPLDYGTPDGVRKSPVLKTIAQFFAGFAFWIAEYLFLISIKRHLSRLVRPGHFMFVQWTTIIVLLLVTIAFGTWLHIRHRWIGFLPGFLFGLLLFVGLVSLLLFMMSHAHS